MHYIADLANSNDADDIFDYDFVESLLRNGADINCKDTTGQTIFHEVARSWNTDVAIFLVKNGKCFFQSAISQLRTIFQLFERTVYNDRKL